VTDIIEKLKAISQRANYQVDNINYGGCAVMAYIVGRHLEDMGIEVEGIVPNTNPRQAAGETPRPHKHDAFWWEQNGINFNHVALRFKVDGKVYTYDTDQLHRGSLKFGEDLRYKAGCKFGNGFKIKELKKIAATGHGYWNCDFNRKDIPKLRKIVKEVFTQDEK
jgi:hypothetical protein